MNVKSFLASRHWALSQHPCAYCRRSLLDRMGRSSPGSSIRRARPLQSRSRLRQILFRKGRSSRRCTRFGRASVETAETKLACRRCPGCFCIQSQLLVTLFAEMKKVCDSWSFASHRSAFCRGPRLRDQLVVYGYRRIEVEGGYPVERSWTAQPCPIS